MLFYVSTILNASFLSSQLSDIETLIENNYVRWKRDVEIALDLLGLDFAMEKQLSKSTDKSEHEKWEIVNRLCLKIIKHSIFDSIMGAIPDNENAKGLVDAIGMRFVEYDKAETGDMMDKLINMRYAGASGTLAFVCFEYSFVDVPL
ncbi:unnamed protein product [Fraxinus pennsylvanica]|uniref:Uncharacterized protein n=1 Tax=Fraxinus pennsylvanica TaxID=56036 RepID=A0AAD2AAG4_9LAMI|nr:unnamed protein product [Fraxinus pennsylvanica]